MPSSPIIKRLDSYPERWRWKEKIILSDSKTHHYYSVHYIELDYLSLPVCGASKGDWMAELICCPLDESPAKLDNWYQVEDLVKEHTEVLDTIEMLFDISFHESIWKEISPEQTLKDNPLI